MIDGTSKHGHQKVIIKIFSIRYLSFLDVIEDNNDGNLQYDVDDDDESEFTQQTLQIPANTFSTRKFLSF